MEQYIPSKDIRYYLDKINFRFSDSEKATIIYNSNTCLQKIHEELICFLQALFGEKCKIFLENVASPNWRKLQSLGRQLSCQPQAIADHI